MRCYLAVLKAYMLTKKGEYMPLNQNHDIEGQNRKKEQLRMARVMNFLKRVMPVLHRNHIDEQELSQELFRSLVEIWNSVD